MKKIYTLLFSLLFILSFHASKAQTQCIFYTNMGVFIVEMHDTLAPITSGNFVDLTKKGYYDGTIFHRVINNFMIQGGDPTGTGSGGPGYTIPDEFHVSLSNVQGTISMANAGPNTGGSQFFINLINNTRLDFNKAPLTSKHPVFGFVLHNFNYVQDIGRVSTNASDRPLNAVIIDSLRVFFDPTTAIDEVVDEEATIQVFPNPVTAQSVISWESKTRQKIYISIFDQTGKRIGEHDRILESGSNSFPLKEVFSASPSAGVYFLAIFDGEMVYNKKLVIE